MSRLDRGGRCCTRLLLQNYHSFNKSGVPARVMYYENGSWHDISSEVLEKLRNAFVERKPVVELTYDGSRYLFDLVRMLQIHIETGGQRSIAWIDEKGSCFFPQMFLGQEAVEDPAPIPENPEVQIEIRIDGKSLKRKRDVGKNKIEDPEVTSVNKEEDASKRKALVVAAAAADFGTIAVTMPKWPNARLLKEEDRAYSAVANIFLSAMRNIDTGVTITAIHQCTRACPVGNARLGVFQKQNEIIRATRGASRIVYAWHGTSAKELESIVAYGFGLPRTIPGIVTYGLGFYFTPVWMPHLSARLSVADDNGERHVILCRVILGNVERVGAGSKQQYPSSLDFDTGADNPIKPNLYVLWSTNVNRHVLPECVVSYRLSSPVPAGFRYSMEDLLLKVRSFLVPTKIDEVAALYDSYRGGGLTKDKFLRMLRGIVGDEILMPIVRDMRASK